MSNTIIFAGTQDVAVPALAATHAWCVANDHELLVLTQPDRPAGRGRKLKASAVKVLADELSIPVKQPTTLKTPEAQQQLSQLSPKLMIVAVYNMLLPQPVLDIPRFGCVNIHPSLLPRWRGAAPVKRAIEAGDRQTGVTLMQMDAGWDTGPVFLRRATWIKPGETADELDARLAQMGARMLGELLPELLAGNLTLQPQDSRFATYAKKLSKEEALIDWQLPAKALAWKVRAFNPWPVAFTYHDKTLLRIWEARPIVREEADLRTVPGTVLGASREGIDVATAKGYLRITRIQRAGGKVLTAREFLNAYSFDGAVLR